MDKEQKYERTLLHIKRIAKIILDPNWEYSEAIIKEEWEHIVDCIEQVMDEDENN